MADEKIIKKLEQLLEELEESLKKCHKKILRKSEADEIIKKTKEEVAHFLPTDSDAYRIFESRTKERFRWSVQSHSDYAEQIDCKGLKDMITILKEVLKEYTPDFFHEKQGKTEFILLKGETFAAKIKVFDIMKRSEESLVIIDAYAGQDNEILKYIDSIKQLKKNLKVQILTEKVSPIFKDLYNDLVRERGNIEVKKIKNVLHDRYLIIDKSEVWVVTSANMIGKKNFTIMKLKDKETKSKLIKDFNGHWINAKDLDDEND